MLTWKTSRAQIFLNTYSKKINVFRYKFFQLCEFKKLFQCWLLRYLYWKSGFNVLTFAVTSNSNCKPIIIILKVALFICLFVCFKTNLKTMLKNSECIQTCLAASNNHQSKKTPINKDQPYSHLMRSFSDHLCIIT